MTLMNPPAFNGVNVDIFRTDNSVAGQLLCEN